MLKKTRLLFTITGSLSLLLFSHTVSAQDNSPYSRYGLGDLFPAHNISSRAMGGITAGYADVISVNFSNPASYSQFQAFQEPKTKKVSSGRVILDVGVNFDNRTLIAPNTPNKFSSADALFSHIQVGLPIRKNWGMSFGIRPVSRISYLISRTELLKDPVTGNPIDSAYTEFEGRGGSYLPTIGTGFAVGNFSAGINLGYLFGRKELNTRRNLYNDSTIYTASDHQTTTSFGDLFLNAGLQYKIDLNKQTILRLGLSGNWQQNIKASSDSLRQTYILGNSGQELQIDSVYERNDVAGQIIFPANYKAGFVIQNSQETGRGWLFGLDYSIGKWNSYRFFGKTDSVQDSWMLNAGGQISPKPQANYFSRVMYRFGAFAGEDYIRVQNKLPVFGLSFGMGLPIGNYTKVSANQFSVINLSLEYAKRGTNDNRLKENMFRISVGLNFTDLWFIKRKYD